MVSRTGSCQPAREDGGSRCLGTHSCAIRPAGGPTRGLTASENDVKPWAPQVLGTAGAPATSSHGLELHIVAGSGHPGAPGRSVLRRTKEACDPRRRDRFYHVAGERPSRLGRQWPELGEIGPKPADAKPLDGEGTLKNSRCSRGARTPGRFRAPKRLKMKQSGNRNFRFAS
jgi:hypothetical protein